MSTQDDHPVGDLAALALVVLGDDEAGPVRTHLEGCAWCRSELAELRETASWSASAADAGDLVAPGAVPADLAGGSTRTAGPDSELLAGALRAVRAQRRRGRALVLAVGAGAVAAAVVVGGVAGAWLDLGGRSTGTIAAPSPTVSPSVSPSGSSTASPTVPPPSGAVLLVGRSPDTGAAADVAIEPADGWVRLAVTVSGVPVGQRCRVVVLTVDGRRVDAGSWTVGQPPPGAPRRAVQVAAAVPVAEVAAVAVETLAGEPVVTAQV